MTDNLEAKLAIIENEGGKSHQVKIVESFLGEVVKYMDISNTSLSPEEKEFAIKAITHINERLTNDGLKWNEVAVAKCRLPEQIKELALKGLSFSSSELYLDLRNNKSNPLLHDLEGKEIIDYMKGDKPVYKTQKDIKIKMQYQGAKKEIINFCDKNIVRFKEILLVEGESLEIEEDIKTGLDYIVGIKNKKSDRDKLMNEKKNVTDVYVIAYEEREDVIIQHIAHADKTRIDRAFDMAATKKIWLSDPKRMLIKTGYWVLRNNVLDSWMTSPKATTKLLNDDMNFDDKKKYDYDVVDQKESDKPKEIKLADMD